MKNPERRRQAAAGAVVVLGYLVILAAGNAVVPRHGTGHAVGTAALYLVALVLLSAVLVPVVMVFIATRPMPQQCAQRLSEVAAQVGVHVRGFRLLKGRARKVANAAQIGMLPGFRFVIVTDYLMDHLNDAELQAVVAHELGHARRHHLLKKLGIVLVCWGALVGSVSLASHTAAPGHHAWVAVLAVGALPVGLVLVQGLVGVRMEEQADDIAAKTAGPADRRPGGARLRPRQSRRAEPHQARHRANMVRPDAAPRVGASHKAHPCHVGVAGGDSRA